MTVIGLDDTDSRRLGMCTTYVAARLAERLAAEGHVERTLLVRLNPAVEHKTRGNAALAVHCDVAPERALDLGEQALERAVTEDDQTNPGLVVADCLPEEVPATVSRFAADAVQEKHDRDTAKRVADEAGFAVASAGNGRGVIGALAAVGAWRAFEEWTYECISYRERERWGTDREVDYDSLLAAADSGYPTVWDTVDREEGEAVCVPRTPCPILHGIRGDDPDAVRDVADAIESEPVDRRQVFLTNQGTDVHLQDGTPATVSDGRAYRLTAEVLTAPETQEGGHVFFSVDSDGESLDVAAFEPTKRFRDHVRKLRVGDRLTVCGEVSDGTLKLEKLAVRDLVETELVTPDCPDCGNSMKSAGRNAGYRCRDCSTSAEGKVSRPLDRALDRGWYEVPPCARRHIAKPLVRGGFDAPTHPER
ncbi:tRNA(Ile2) 2-agmatinylcytidine synthetase [Halovenus aranensis]|uniref:tRNA(Ile2) 2-agmatinylcytidine synthetase TiaS n=1 Tax=Halovenus aranensis TaxID=890420 RepID=A0A1G8S2K9_9EURY|nr:tRNA(Ile)(2)-agmatinylcytidine synthase [Halovenus aranensis]SDJ23433.1 tRNA(Ile2) 2-agmatinylcytidine synthetase [Halovenus aranensis]